MHRFVILLVVILAFSMSTVAMSSKLGTPDKGSVPVTQAAESSGTTGRVGSSGSLESSEPADPVSRGERAWAARAVRDGERDGARDGDAVRPDPEAVEKALTAWRDAVARNPEHPGLRARLLQALHFQGEYLIEGEDVLREHFDAARKLAQEGFERLARRLGGAGALKDLEAGERAEALRPLLDDAEWTATDLAALHLRGAIVWGKWAERVGAFKAAREGVAGELRTLAGTALELDETFSDAGPHRFLGRLHAEAPKIPFFTGWVDRGQAVRHLERAVELAPEEPQNLLFLAEVLREHRPGRRGEARELLRKLADREPRSDHLLEDTRALERARELLAEP